MNRPVLFRGGICVLVLLSVCCWLLSRDRASESSGSQSSTHVEVAPNGGRTWVESAVGEGVGSSKVFDIDKEVAALDIAVTTSEVGAPKPMPRSGVEPIGDAVGPVVQWRERGRQAQYEVALDEVYVGLSEGREHGVERVPLQKDLAGVVKETERVSAEKALSAHLVLYPKGAKRTEWTRRVLSRSVLLEATDATALRAQAAKLGVVNFEQPKFAPGYVLANLGGDAAVALAATAAMQSLPGITSATPMLASQKQSKATIPNDPLFPSQWHLRNTGQRGGTKNIDARVVNVWDNFQGDGTTIGIVDDGLDLTHEDIAPNAAASGHFDWNGNDSNPAPDPTAEDFHGTAVGGVAAGRGGNGVGISGVAPHATLYGLRLISSPTTDGQDASAMDHLSSVIQIKNNSWGAPDDFASLGYVGPLFAAALDDATSTGRGGKGTLFFWAAGNGRDIFDQGNKDAAANNIHVIPVGALNNRGALSYYSETGSHLMIVAPSSGGTSGIFTTDLEGTDGYNDGSTSSETANDDYTNDFGGTSSAAPLASGVGALILQANPNLGWRDVKEILLRSSTKIASTSSGWTSRTGGQLALPPIKHHHNYGGGLINAEAAVALAQGWQNLPAETNLEITNNTRVVIPDATSNVTEIFDFSAMAPIRVEHVEVTLDIDHTYRGDLDISLVSPSGVISELASRSVYDDGDSVGQGYWDWTFTSVRHWGEASNGQWKVIIRDQFRGDVGTANYVTVRLHGVSAPPAAFAASGEPEGLLVAEGSFAQLSSATTGYPTINHQWRKTGKNIAGATGSAYVVPSIALTHAGLYSDRISNVTGSAISPEVPLGVVRVTNDSPVYNEGTTMVLAATAAGGVPLTYQWKLGGVDLVDDGRITGTMSPTLTVRSTTTLDDGDYECIISDGVRTLSAGTRQVQIRLKPVVQGMAISGAVVSQLSNIQIIADNAATRFTATGLPSGVKLNATTGLLSGRPLKAGDYTITVYATNAAGRSAAQTFFWHVEDLDDDVVGAFQGLVDADAGLNSDLGGSLTAKVTGTGTYSGAVQLGSKRYSFKGLLDSAPGTDPTSSSTITRRGLPSLVLTLTISNSTGELTGSITDGTDSAGLLARRNPWNARTASAEAFAGYYTFGMDLSSNIGDPAVPQGTGYGTATASTGGTIKWAGRLADGTAVTGSSIFDLGGLWSSFNLLYAAKGSLHGWRDMDLGPGVNFSLNTMGGSLTWLRQPQAATVRLYSGGFGPISLNVHGGKYTKPSAGLIVLGLDDPTTFVDGKNAVIAFAGGGIETASRFAGLDLEAFTISSRNIASFAKAGTPENPASLRLSLNAATGLFSGGFVLSDVNPASPTTTVTRSVGYFGVLLSQELKGKGYFVSPTLPEASPAPVVAPSKTPIIGGGVVIDAAPH